MCTWCTHSKKRYNLHLHMCQLRDLKKWEICKGKGRGEVHNKNLAYIFIFSFLQLAVTLYTVLNYWHQNIQTPYDESNVQRLLFLEFMWHVILYLQQQFPDEYPHFFLCFVPTLVVIECMCNELHMHARHVCTMTLENQWPLLMLSKLHRSTQLYSGGANLSCAAVYYKPLVAVKTNMPNYKQKTHEHSGLLSLYTSEHRGGSYMASCWGSQRPENFKNCCLLLFCFSRLFGAVYQERQVRSCAFGRNGQKSRIPWENRVGRQECVLFLCVPRQVSVENVLP